MSRLASLGHLATSWYCLDDFDTQAKAAGGGGGAAILFTVTLDGDTSPEMSKSSAVREIVAALAIVGVAMRTVVMTLKGTTKLLAVSGHLTGDQLWAALEGEHATARGKRGQLFVSQPIHQGGATWVLRSKCLGQGR